jgi:ribosomal protein L11 methyltransferase
MSWIELKLDVPNHLVEQISAYLFANGCEGINVREEEVVVYFSTHRWSNEVKVSVIKFIQYVVPGFSAKNITVQSLTEHDWNADWKKHFKPVKITGMVAVRPPWEEYKASTGEIVITINPKMAFGTGHHESTKLVMVEMVKFVKPGMHVLDLGTGSGILAILANQLGADAVLGVDNDMESIKNSTENLALNNITSGVQFGFAELQQVTPSDYDVVVANINKNVLMQNAPLLPEYLKLGGYLILSGILLRDEISITQQYRSNGFEIKKRNAMKDWLSLVFELVKKEEN